MELFLDVTTGHGYKPWRLAALLPLLYLATVLMISRAQAHHGFVPVTTPDKTVVTAAQCTSHYPCLSRWAYPIDYIIPIINLHQADSWRLDASTSWGNTARNWTYLATGLGWAATTLLVGAFTGLIKKD